MGPGEPGFHVHYFAARAGEKLETLKPEKARRGMLAEELEDHEPRQTYLATEYGKPFASSWALDNRVRKWIVAADLVGKDGKANRSQQGIRKGVAELMAAYGATEYELMSAFGWTEAKTAGIYNKKFQRRGGCGGGIQAACLRASWTTPRKSWSSFWPKRQ